MLNASSFLRPSESVPPRLRQMVYIANILSSILSGLTFILVLILFNMFGWIATLKYVMLVALLFISVPIINRKFYSFGRLLFCLTPVWMTLFVSLYGKIIHINQSYLTYFDSRFILLATTILPPTVFRLEERLKIVLCLASTFICLLLYDPIHNALGLGFFQRGFTVASYYYINYITLISYFTVLFGIITLKSITEKAERSAQLLIEEKEFINAQLARQNQELIHLNTEVEAQNEEMQQQHEELSAGRDKLEEANVLISNQKDMLAHYNLQLQGLVEEKSKSLNIANEELVKHNNELRQFSYTVSHNLRGPVARLLGLSQLLNGAMSEEERLKVLAFINQSTHDLDAVLKDLNIIIDIRNELYNIREKILMAEEWQKVVSILGDNIKPEFIIETDFSRAPYVYAIRPMMHSIFYNLLSNAIKYRSPERILLVRVSTSLGSSQETIFEIQDNGLGFDLTKQQENVFKLYKRFHTHVMGKGLGLFIVKTQLEIMDGSIEVESQLNKGTLFRLVLPKPAEVAKQIFYESEAAQLHFDAELNTTVIVWKRTITSVEYRNVFESMLQNLKTYSTPSWIADLREQGTIIEEDQLWFVQTVIPEAVRNGLKRIISIGFKDPIRRSYLSRMKEKTTELGLDFFILDTPEEAREIAKGFLFRK